MDINIVIKRSVIYSILIALITLIYLILVHITEKVFQGFLGYNSLISSVSIVFIIAVIFAPLRNRVQYFVDKILFKGSTPEIAQENVLLRKKVAQSEKLKAVSTLASGMAHEIKNPLTAIKTFTEYLPDKKNDPDFLQKFSRIVGKEVDRIDDLVQQLLDFAKPSPLMKTRTDIHKLINEIIEFLNSKFVKNKINIVRQFPSDIIYLHIDANQFKQALLNILINAIDAMPYGGTLTIKTKINNTKQYLLVTIQDTGPGISKKDLPHIFNPFFSKKDKGTGLGLSITKGITEEHGGEISVKSSDEKGTTFVIKLPITSNG